MVQAKVPPPRDEKNTPAENGGRTPSFAEPNWRKSSSRKPRRLRRLWFGLATLGLAATAVLLVWVSTWVRPPRSIDLVLLGADYGDNLFVPQNTYGWNVLEDLASLTDDPNLQTWGTRLVKLVHPPMELHSQSRWKQSLLAADNRTILIYVSACGASDEKGPYVLLSNAENADADYRLPLSEILDELAKQPSYRHKMLILDCTGMTAQWSLGVLQNDFARALQTLEPRIRAIPNLVVVNSSSPDQCSWTCSSWRQTVFGHYLLEGLKGGVPDTNDDARIDLWDLYEGVCDNTNAWVQANRAARQTPMILPSGTGGYGRARNIDLVPASRHYEAPTFESPASGDVSDDVVDAWKTHERLAQAVPSPAVHAPFAWRRYQDLLIRYEELVVAGNQEDAATVRRRMLESRLEIQRKLVSGLASIQNSLGMYETLHCESQSAGGSTSESNANAQKALQSLWNAAPADRAKRWDKLRAAAGDSPSVEHLRMALHELVVQRVAETPAENLATGSALIQLLADPLHPRPAESHFLVMLAADLPDTPWNDQKRELIRLALQVRQLAERTAWNYQGDAYAFSGRVLPHIQGLVEKADQSRRLGEDLLIADSGDYERAEKQLRQAQSLYQEAAKRGAAVAAALDTYERAMADLPYFAHWLANKRADYRDNRALHQKWLEEMEALLRDTHRLGQTLRVPSSKNETDSEVQNIVSQTDRVSKAFQKSEQELEENWLLMASADSPQAWCDMRDALRVPQHDSALRIKLLKRMRQTELRLASEPLAERSRPSHVTAQQQTDRAKWAAAAQGRMALAVLGADTYEILQGKQQLSFAQLEHCLNVFRVEQRWWQTLAGAGAVVGTAWSALPGATDARSQAAVKAAPSQTLQSLGEAELLSRLLPGCAELTSAREPAEEARRARFRELLQWQVQRTCDDHWYSETPDSEPYYQVAAGTYLSDAATVYPGWPADKALEKRVSAAGGLQFSVTEGVDVSSQRRIEVPVRLAAAQNADVPEGYPVVWFDVGASLQLLQPGPQRTACLWKASEKLNPLICDLTSKALEQSEQVLPSTPTVADTELTLHGRFRGQQITTRVPIRLHLTADVMRAYYGPSETASVAMRADETLHRKYGDGNGAVAIVLDCTGSMGPPEGSPFSATTKYAEATAALGRVLASLPRGTTVSVWVFGQAVGTEKTVAEPEKTILQVLTPTSWNPDDSGQLQALMAKIQYPALEPWNESPIVRAILAAKNDVDKADGFKTIVVLTDGIDNRVAADKEINPGGKDVPTLLKDAFRKSGVELNIVGFRMSPKEEPEGWKQFKVVESFFPPGMFCTVSESASLAEALDAALRQRLRYWIENTNHQNLKGVPVRGLEVGRTGENNQWYPAALKPGNYFLQINADQRIDKPIALNRGDRLLVRVAKTDAGLQLERVVYGRSDFSWKPAAQSDAWRATLLQNQRIGNDRLQMLVGLEPNGDGSGKVISETRPAQAWIEVEPIKAEGDFLLRWNTTWGYPVAAWRLNVPRWPCSDQKEPAGSQVKMWWSSDDGSAPDVILQRPTDFAELGDLAGKEVVIRGQKILIESLSVEDHAVQTGPGKRETRTCLVVRLRGPANQTVWAKPGGTDTTGEEHRFYGDIGHYVGLFWPVTQDAVDAALRHLELLSLETFKRSAEEHGNTIELNKLPAPDPNDVGPQPASS